MSTRRAWTGRELDRCRWWRHQGVKLAVIAKRLGRTVPSVSHALSRAGVVLHPDRRARCRDRARQVARLLRAGKSVSEVAELLGLYVSYVSRVRARLGIPPASRSQRVALSWVFRKARGDRPPNAWEHGRVRVPAFPTTYAGREVRDAV